MHVAARYPATRLHFKREIIDRLRPDDAFEVVTPIGVFRMTRNEFEETFPNVLKTRSWNEGAREYHYPAPPKRALAYLVK